MDRVVHGVIEHRLSLGRAPPFSESRTTSRGGPLRATGGGQGVVGAKTVTDGPETSRSWVKSGLTIVKGSSSFNLTET